MKNLISFIAVLAICLAVNSSAVAQKVVVTPDQIPADFKDYKDTLLIIDFPVVLGYKKFLKKNFAEYYSGPYKIVTRKQYIEEKMGQKLRFLFQGGYDYELNVGMKSEKFIYYTLSDKQMGKHYKTMHTKYYSELMIKYIKALDAELKKN